MEDRRTELDGIDVVGHNIPDKHEVAAKKFDILAAMLAESGQDSPRYTVIDGEIKKRVAKNSAAIHLKNVIIGACAG